MDIIIHKSKINLIYLEFEACLLTKHLTNNLENLPP